MRQAAYTLLSISSLSCLSQAWPLIPGTHQRRAPASYSVVAVDGGNAGGAATPTTVTDSIIHTETVLKTQLSTIVITESERPSTIIVTITSASPVTITEQPPPSIATHTITAIPETTAQPSQSRTFGPAAPPATVTVTQPLPSTKAYDDGMWHTNYYYTVSEGTEITSSSIPSSTLESIYPEPTTSDHLFWWDGPEVSTNIETTTTETTVTTSIADDWATRIWGLPASDSPAEATTTSSVLGATVSVPFWGGLPSLSPVATTTSTLS